MIPFYITNLYIFFYSKEVKKAKPSTTSSASSSETESLSWVSDWPPMKINKGSLLTGSNSGGDLDHQPVPFSQFKQRRLLKKQKLL